MRQSFGVWLGLQSIRAALPAATHPKTSSAPPWGTGETGFELLGKMEAQIAIANQRLEF